jgi:hypothetical protein
MVGNRKSSIKKYIQNWHLWALLIVIQGCMYSSVPKYGDDFNMEREKIGLPIVKANWEHYKIYGAMAEGWINPTRIKDIPYYFKKTVLFNTDTIIEECDEYIGLKEFVTIDGKFKESLYISYRFIEDEEHDKGWRYALSTGTIPTIATISNRPNLQKAYSTHTIILITKATADSILVSWGLHSYE